MDNEQILTTKLPRPVFPPKRTGGVSLTGKQLFAGSSLVKSHPASICGMYATFND
jgi:hypothetical protein